MFKLKEERSKIACILLVAIPIVTYFCYIFLYSPNAPWFDDVHDIIEFMVLFHQQESFFGQYQMLFRRHNESRMVYSHIVYLLQYSIVGQLNFTYLTIIANLALLAGFITHIVQIKGSPNKAFIAAGCSLLTFQLTSQYIMTWAMSTSFVGVYFFAYISFIFMHKNTLKNTLIAAAFGCLAIYTNANGFIVLPAVMLTQAFCIFSDKNSLQTREKSQYLLLYSMILSLSLYLYFFNTRLSYGFLDKLLDQLPFYSSVLQNYLFLLGSAYSFQHYILGVVLGGISVFLIVWLLYKRYYLVRPDLMSFMFFTLGSLAVIAIVRGQDGKPGSVMITYYFLLSVHLWVCLFIAYSELYLARLKGVWERAPLVIIICLCALWAYSYGVNTAIIQKDCISKKTYIYQRNIDMQDGSYEPRYSGDKFVLMSINKGYINPAPQLDDYQFPFLSRHANCDVSDKLN